MHFSKTGQIRKSLLISHSRTRYNSHELSYKPSKILEIALSVFGSPQLKTKIPYKAFNGIFALTPDGTPLAGAIPQISGLYTAVAVWITHAARVARLVADIVSEKQLSQ